MCFKNIIFSQPNTFLILFLSVSTYIHNCIMVYASLACISVAMMSRIESFANIKGERFRFHLQTPEVRNTKFSLSYSTEMNIKGRSWSPSNCPFGELGKTWEATKCKWLTFEKKNYVCRKQARPSPARSRPFLGTEFHGPARADLCYVHRIHSY